MYSCMPATQVRVPEKISYERTVVSYPGVRYLVLYWVLMATSSCQREVKKFISSSDYHGFLHPETDLLSEMLDFQKR